MSNHSFAFRVFLFAASATLSMTVACGRSDIIDYTVGDGGPTFDSGDGSTGCTSTADCPTGEACDTTTHMCVPSTCANCEAPTPYCRTDTDQCVACLTNAECPAGEACDDYHCVGFCGTGAACATGTTCCSPLCVDEATDPENCGSCGFACGPYAHATAACAASSCDIGSCNAGFADCNHVLADGCETNTASSAENCGTCGHACAAGDTCSGGECVGACGANGTCPTGESCCGATCANETSDPNHCGSCGTVCGAVENGSTTCAASHCVISACAAGFADCNGIEADGCEANLGTDVSDCGVCGQACASGESCVSGECTAATCATTGCPANDTCCGAVCIDTTDDAQNCGSCGFVCPTGSTCAASQCQPATSCDGGPACTVGQACCATGCSNTSTDSNNCGGCGIACPPGDTCVASVCTSTGCNDGGLCTTGETCCTSGCSNTTSDPNNCGSCGRVCPTGDTCVANVCTAPTRCNGGPACAVGLSCCTSGCVNEQTDTSNCGGCGITCGATTSCTDGSCATNEGAFDPIVNPTYLSPGVHVFTTINIPAGVVVYVGGAGAASGTLDLEATGAVVINGTIDVSGGPGTQNTITSQSTDAGRAGSGGFTGEPYESAVESAACAFIAGNPGTLGDAVSGSAGTCTVLSTTTCVDMSDPSALVFTSPVAAYGGGAGVFTGYRAYGSGGGGPAGGAPGALGAPFTGEQDCSGASGGGGATGGNGGSGGGSPYDGANGALGQTQCAGIQNGAPAAYVGGGGGGSIGTAAANDLAVLTTFQTGSSGGGGSADYLDRPVYGGTSGGGGAGGALKVASPVSITITGSLLANGGLGGDAFIGSAAPNCDPQPGAAGGGGSGGVIYLSSPALTVGSGATISAAGGAGGAGSEFATGGAGGAGGLGRIRISATAASCSLAGTFTPRVSSGCAATSARGFAYVGTYPN